MHEWQSNPHKLKYPNIWHNRIKDERVVQMKKYVYCAKCGCELGKTVWRVLDNFLQVKYFDEIDGSDNAFCSEECLLRSISAEEVANTSEIVGIYKTQIASSQKSSIVGLCSQQNKTKWRKHLSKNREMFVKM